ncbi:MAG TPA: PilZ domain-containing protein [Thermodesulfovibrionales bacterium]|nr:PilZ domain-containing protein [Thermodesulfovibrionales bacterium]
MEQGKRKHSRFDYSEIISYALPPYIDNKVSTGLIHNFSYFGLCIITQQPIQEGQEILVKSRIMSKPVTAVVRWCNETGSSTYKVGLEISR